MIELPSLDLVQLVRLTREGGLAYLPGLAQPRHIDMATCPPGVRQEVCDALQHAAPKAVPACAQAGGDQRYFHVEVVYEGSATADISFDVPEADAPETLVRLWKDQAGQSG
ncbi:protealysin inhibitor emfourin [Achromobacter sp.]|uniref:protealysin inhibitor emfourin n=1 Tax=Achromobacter sp. TaxID=134375 RepID=UPI0028B1F350|nr:protealysin inhibitor emfourin [Achromobacter sp.]